MVVDNTIVDLEERIVPVAPGTTPDQRFGGVLLLTSDDTLDLTRGSVEPATRNSPKEYQNLAAVGAAGFASSGSVYASARRYFAQDPFPGPLVIARWADEASPPRIVGAAPITLNEIKNLAQQALIGGTAGQLNEIISASRQTFTGGSPGSPGDIAARSSDTLSVTVGGETAATATLSGLSGLNTPAAIASAIQTAIRDITAGTGIAWGEIEFTWNGSAYVLTGGAGYNGRLGDPAIAPGNAGEIADELGFGSGDSPDLVSPTMTLRLGSTTVYTIGPFPAMADNALGGAASRNVIASRIQAAIRSYANAAAVTFAWNDPNFVLTGGTGPTGRLRTGSFVSGTGSGLADALGFGSGDNPNPSTVAPSLTLRIGSNPSTSIVVEVADVSDERAVASAVQAAIRGATLGLGEEAANVTFTWDSDDGRYVLTGTRNTGGSLTATSVTGGDLANALGMSAGLSGLHFDPGIETAETAEVVMNAIQGENDSWYWVVAAEGVVDGDGDIAREGFAKLNSLADWCEKNRKQFIYGSNRSTDDVAARSLYANVNTAAADQRYDPHASPQTWGSESQKSLRDAAWAGMDVADDVADSATSTSKAVRLIKKNRERTTVLYGGTNRAIALAGKFAASNLDDGKRLITAKFQQLAGTDNGDPLTPTQIAVMNERRINHYTRVAGTPVVREGVTTNSSRFIDTRYWLDWFGHRVRVDIWNLLTSNPRVPLTNEGVVSIRNVVEAVCQRGVENGGLGRGQLTPETIDQVQRVTSTPGFDGYLTDGYLVYVAPVSTLTDSQLTTERVSPPIYVWMKGSPAVHKVDIRAVFS